MSRLEDITNRTKGHTEGPWTALEGEDANAVVSASSRLSVTWDDHGGEVFMNRADSELIAAAPDMLAALQAVEKNLTAWNDYYDDDDIPGSIVFSMSRSIRSAIDSALS